MVTERELSTVFLILPWVYFSAAHTVSFTSFTVVMETPLNGNSWGNYLPWPPRDTLCGVCRLSPFHLMPSCLESISLVESLKKASGCWGNPSISVLVTLFPRKRTEEQTTNFSLNPMLGLLIGSHLLFTAALQMELCLYSFYR